MNLLRSLIFLFATFAFALINWSCGPQPMAGGTSETTNGFVAVIRSPSGEPVSHAMVRLRPEGYLSDTANAAISYDSASIIDTFTDANGRLKITNIDTGKYSIEIQDQAGEGMLFKCSALKDSIVDCGIAVVTSEGSIRGFINRKSFADSIAVYVRVYGMERMVRADLASGSFVLPGMPFGNHAIYFIASSSSYEPREVIASVSSDSVSDVGKVSLFPYHGWGYSKVLAFNTTASGAAIAENVYAFPVLVRLHSGNFTFSQAKPSGEDIRFAKSDSTPLPYQIERWDPVTGRAEVWVKIDTVFGNSDKQFITMLWGASTPSTSSGTSATPESNGAAVFDTASGFQGVWHLGDAPEDSVRDATANRYHGISPDSARPIISEGIIGNCRKFDGNGDYITMPNTAAGTLDFPQNGRYSVSAWVMADTFIDLQQTLVSKDKYQYFIWLSSTSWQFCEYQDRAGWEVSAQPAVLKQWVLLTGVRDGATQHLYVNGEPVDSATLKSFAEPRSAASDLILGRAHELGTFPNPQAGYCSFRGGIDEVRVCGTAPSIGWIKLCYMNQRPDDKLIIFK
jgi:hypothetical protein